MSRMIIIREAFPIFKNNPKLVYLDNAATTHKPSCVTDAIGEFYDNNNSNVSRGTYNLADFAERLFTDAREKVSKFINAKNKNQIIFTSGTTDSINLLANSIVDTYKYETVLLSTMEHHSNIIPFLMQERKRDYFSIQVLKIDDTLNIDLNILEDMLKIGRIDFMSITHVSNVTGIINPIKEICSLAHKYNVKVIVDGAQAVGHMEVDVQDMDCDFYCFSAHKMYGPMGVGVMYGKEEYLEDMQPYQGGGGMNQNVTFKCFIEEYPPYKFEAGTPNVAGVIGLAKAIDYIGKVKALGIYKYEYSMLEYLTSKLLKIPEITIYGNTRNKIPIISFSVEGIHPLQIASKLNKKNIAVRAGKHCAMPFVNTLNNEGVVRASLSFYNTCDEINIFIDEVKNIIKKLKQ